MRRSASPLLWFVCTGSASAQHFVKVWRARSHAVFAAASVLHRTILQRSEFICNGFLLTLPGVTKATFVQIRWSNGAMGR